MKRKVVAIIGDNRIEENGIKYMLAFETGRYLLKLVTVFNQAGLAA